MVINSHYTRDLDGAYLRAYAEEAVEVIKKTRGDLRPLLIFQGLSGTTRASAISLLYPEVDMFYVRKPGEKSRVPDGTNVHFYTIERFNHKVYFIDDLIETGGTLKRCLSDYDLSYRHGYSGDRDLLINNQIIIALVSEIDGFPDIPFYLNNKSIKVKEYRVGLFGRS